MRIVHTEASTGWGGQEIRILREAKGMRDRGHEVLFIVQPGAQLVSRARDEGFEVMELCFRRKSIFRSLPKLYRFLRKRSIDLVNTHSSLDAWLAGAAARLAGVKVLRTRHLSAQIRKGLNSRILYGKLADAVVTTCEEIAERIRQQAHLSAQRCLSIPTGIDLDAQVVSAEERRLFRAQYGISESACLAGTICVLRSWKGVGELLQAAKALEHLKDLHWIVVGDGPYREALEAQAAELGVADRVIFTGQIADPRAAFAALDIFLLLSTANEGVSQSSLQAACMGKPLVTTPTGGLKEVCIPGTSGFVVDIRSAEQVAQAVEKLQSSAALREQLGKGAQNLASRRFTFDSMLDQMEAVYSRL